MAIKRLSILRSLSGIGIDLGRISLKLSMYVVVAAIAYFFTAALLMVMAPNPFILAFYTIFFILFVSLQIVQMIRCDREDVTRIQFELDVQNYIQARRK